MTGTLTRRKFWRTRFSIGVSCTFPVVGEPLLWFARFLRVDVEVSDLCFACDFSGEDIFFCSCGIGVLVVGETTRIAMRRRAGGNGVIS